MSTIKIDIEKMTPLEIIEKLNYAYRNEVIHMLYMIYDAHMVDRLTLEDLEEFASKYDVDLEEYWWNKKQEEKE